MVVNLLSLFLCTVINFQDNNLVDLWLKTCFMAKRVRNCSFTITSAMMKNKLSKLNMNKAHRNDQMHTRMLV